MNSFQRLGCVIPREFWSDLSSVIWRPFGLRTGHSIMAESVSKPTFTSKTLRSVSIDPYACQSNSPDEDSMKRLSLEHDKCQSLPIRVSFCKLKIEK